MLTGYIAGRMVGTPLIINGEHGTFYADSFKKRTLQRMLFRLMDLNLSVSAELKNSILNAFSIKKDNFKPILNGVDIKKFKPTPDKENVKTQFGLPKRSKVIGYVGRLISGKDVPTLVQAAKKLVTEDQSFHFLIVGDGPERNTIETLINDLDLNHHVHMLGRRDDVPSCLQAMDLFCLPSLSEGLSNTLLEAMATGVPCVACNVGGNPEIVIPEETGELVPTKSPECLYEALSHLTQCDASLKNMAASTRQHIEDNHSIESMVNEYQDTYTYQLNNKLGRVSQSVEANT
jgi:glycosyltransferase involved in cell wall biosynthesis